MRSGQNLRTIHVHEQVDIQQKTVKFFLYKLEAILVLHPLCSDEIFTRIDVDNDGELNVQEFMKGCQEDQVYYLYIQTGNITIIITSIKFNVTTSTVEYHQL